MLQDSVNSWRAFYASKVVEAFSLITFVETLEEVVVSW